MPHPPITDSIVFTYTDDLAASSRFFAETMGLELVVDQGACHIFRLTPLSYLGVCHIPGRPRSTAGITITLVTSDVEAWHRFLTSKGLAYQQPPEHSDKFNVTSSLFIDPNGYRIEIQSFDDPDWRKGRAPAAMEKGAKAGMAAANSAATKEV